MYNECDSLTCRHKVTRQVDMPLKLINQLSKFIAKFHIYFSSQKVSYLDKLGTDGKEESWRSMLPAQPDDDEIQ